MAEMTAAEAKIFIAQELKALSGPEGCCIQSMQRNQTKRNNLRGLAYLIEQQAAEIDRLKCCGNCNNWINRPEKMSCKIHEIDVAQWCRCGEWQAKAALEDKP